MSSSNNERTATEAEELAAEIVKDIKRSGDFDKVKRDALEELQETVRLLVRSSFLFLLLERNKSLSRLHAKFG